MSKADVNKQPNARTLCNRALEDILSGLNGAKTSLVRMDDRHRFTVGAGAIGVLALDMWCKCRKYYEIVLKVVLLVGRR